MILTGVNKGTQRETVSSVTLSTSKSTFTGIKPRPQQLEDGYLPSGPWQGQILYVIVIIFSIITNICHWISL